MRRTTRGSVWPLPDNTRQPDSLQISKARYECFMLRVRRRWKYWNVAERNANNREKYRRRNPSVIPEIFIPRAETELGWNLISSPRRYRDGQTERREDHLQVCNPSLLHLRRKCWFCGGQRKRRRREGSEAKYPMNRDETKHSQSSPGKIDKVWARDETEDSTKPASWQSNKPTEWRN